MPTSQMIKYVYKIKCSNGAVVDHLQIYGKTEDDAKRKLMQMYRNCEILNTSIATSARQLSTDYGDVLERITGDF
ncbi:MAG: hypothetical protein ACKE5M_07620 [Methylophilaceae bacterium]